MAVRRFQPGQLTGGILLCAVAVAIAGCYQEIAYEPSDDPPLDTGAPTAGSEMEAPESQGELPSAEAGAESPSPETTAPETSPVEAPPTDRYALADAANDVAATPPNDSGEPEQFPADVSPPEPDEGVAAAEPTPAVATQASTSSGALLPWENEAPAEQGTATEPPLQEDRPEVATSPAATAPPEALFPWDEPATPEAATPNEPAEPATPAESAPAESEVAPSSAAEPLPSPAEVASILLEAEVEPRPAAKAPVTSRHAAWLLGSKLSYAMLAPADEGNRVVPELQPLAQLLGVELPALDFEGLRGTPAGMSQLLATGRDVGEKLAARHDPSHAALVEIAMKSNLLLAVHADRPHLTHSIGGSVAAACVRAGIPEEIWQPWQDAVAAGGSSDEISGAVIELHNQIDSFLQNPPNDAAPAILR